MLRVEIPSLRLGRAKRFRPDLRVADVLTAITHNLRGISADMALLIPSSDWMASQVGKGDGRGDCQVGEGQTCCGI